MFCQIEYSATFMSCILFIKYFILLHVLVILIILEKKLCYRLSTFKTIKRYYVFNFMIKYFSFWHAFLTKHLKLIIKRRFHIILVFTRFTEIGSF